VILLLAVPLLLSLRRSIDALVRRTRRLAAGDLETEVTLKGCRELRQLARTFNIMMAARRAAENEIVELTQEYAKACRAAGMAEIVTGVLHNVGNVLNTINVSTDVLIEKSRVSRADRLAMLVDLLESQSVDLGGFFARDPSGAKILPYLRELSVHLVENHDQVLGEIGTLRTSVEHLKTIVAKQQELAGSRSVVETFSLSGLVDDALALARPSFDEYAVVVSKEYLADINLFADRHKLLQILVNLLTNAKDALVDCGKTDKRLVLRTRFTEGDAMAIDVQDNGPGVAPENIARLFTFGFSTKPHGHGFGLHHSSMTATEMGAELRCDSSAEGATFTLALPAAMRQSEIAPEPGGACHLVAGGLTQPSPGRSSAISSPSR
jgi:C4-dicarboxylate-specific signal transduction histidine kinase